MKFNSSSTRVGKLPTTYRRRMSNWGKVRKIVATAVDEDGGRVSADAIAHGPAAAITRLIELADKKYPFRDSQQVAKMLQAVAPALVSELEGGHQGRLLPLAAEDTRREGLHLPRGRRGEPRALHQGRLLLHLREMRGGLRLTPTRPVALTRLNTQQTHTRCSHALMATDGLQRALRLSAFYRPIPSHPIPSHPIPCHAACHPPRGAPRRAPCSSRSRPCTGWGQPAGRCSASSAWPCSARATS